MAFLLFSTDDMTTVKSFCSIQFDDIQISFMGNISFIPGRSKMECVRGSEPGASIVYIFHKFCFHLVSTAVNIYKSPM